MKTTAHGFRTSVIHGLVIQVGQTTGTEISMELGAAGETVTVTATTPLFRSTESSLSTVVSRSLLDGLPLSGRRFTDFAPLTPNSSPDGQSGLVSFGGQQGGEDTGYANGNGANVFTAGTQLSHSPGDSRISTSGLLRDSVSLGRQPAKQWCEAASEYSMRTSMD